MGQNTSRWWRALAMLVCMTLVGAACGGGGSEEGLSITASDDEADDEPAEEEEAPEETPTEEPTAEPTEEPAAFELSQAEASVVKIVAEGSFVDPEVGLQLNAAGIGSGFIISEDGIVVTNNHVVTGSALLRVYVAGSDDPVNAQILGVSECADLAVIDLEGDGYQPLAFRSEPVSAGLSVFSAGYPLVDAPSIEDVDFTLTAGIVSTTNASGETNWASVDGVIEHDARIRGGNSGGPLIDEDGGVVGINYAGIDSADQNFAISAAEAQSVIEILRTGSDVDSLGINGQAILEAETGLSGVWVSSVESGSPADGAGIEAGDIVTALEGLTLATDGSMSDYCDILRTKGPDATYSVEVLRFATEEYLEGQINGTPLEQAFSFAQELSDEVDDVAGPSGDVYSGYANVSDDTGTVSVDVPVEWSQTDGAENPDFGPSIYASSDLEAFLNSYDTPGVIVEATNTLGAGDVVSVLELYDFSADCNYDGRFDFEDELYVGQYEVWSTCNGTDALVLTLVATPPSGDFLIRMLFQAVEERDLDAADNAIKTFFASL